jgi:hypothetical protein
VGDLKVDELFLSATLYMLFASVTVGNALEHLVRLIYSNAHTGQWKGTKVTLGYNFFFDYLLLILYGLALLRFVLHLRANTIEDNCGPGHNLAVNMVTSSNTIFPSCSVSMKDI